MSLTHTFHTKNRAIRQRVLYPILSVLTNLRVSPNMLCHLRLLLIIPYWLLLTSGHFWTAIWVFVAALLTDILDGPLARHQKIDSDRGKFFDMFADQVLYCFAVLSMFVVYPFAPLLLAAHLILVCTTYLLAMLVKHENTKSDWLIHPHAGLSYLKTIGYIAMLLFVGWEVDLLWDVFALLNIWMLLLSIGYYIILARR